MKGYGKRLMAKLLCLSLVFQLGAFQAEAAVTKNAGLCEHKQWR